MKAIVKQPGKPATERNIPGGENLLDNLRNLIDGCIKPVNLHDGVSCFCDEDGIAKRLLGNCGLAGPLVFVATKEDDHCDQWIGLNEAQTRSVGKWIAANEC
jgi:hypothetical protein